MTSPLMLVILSGVRRQPNGVEGPCALPRSVILSESKNLPSPLVMLSEAKDLLSPPAIGMLQLFLRLMNLP